MSSEKALFEYFLGFLGQIKVYHWTTKSYSNHKALDDLHKELGGLVDELMEVYIGKYNPNEVFSITMGANSDSSNVIPYLEEQREFIRGIRNKNFKNCTEIQNILDTMMSSISNTIYLCRLK